MDPYYADDTVTLYHGDAREILPQLGQCADVMVTDPPYGIAHATGRLSRWHKTTIAGDEDTALRDELLDWWAPRPALVFGTWKRARPVGTRQVLVWDKGPAAGMGDLSIPWKPNWEEIYVLGKGFAGPRTTGVLTGHRVVSWSTKGRRHPNEKPVSLLRELVAKCPPGVVLDPLAGSGSTLVAAREAGRKAIGIEADENYCRVIVDRLAQSVLAV